MKIGNLFTCGSMQILPSVEMFAFSTPDRSVVWMNWLVFILASFLDKILR